MPRRKPKATQNRDLTPNLQPDHRILLAHFDGRESTCVIHRPRTPKVPGIALLRSIARIAFDPRRPPALGICNHAIEQR